MVLIKLIAQNTGVSFKIPAEGILGESRIIKDLISSSTYVISIDLPIGIISDAAIYINGGNVQFVNGVRVLLSYLECPSQLIPKTGSMGDVRDYFLYLHSYGIKTDYSAFAIPTVLAQPISFYWLYGKYVLHQLFGEEFNDRLVDLLPAPEVIQEPVMKEAAVNEFIANARHSLSPSPVSSRLIDYLQKFS